MSGVTDYLGLITVEDGESYNPDITNANMATLDAEFEKMRYTSLAYVPVFTGLTAFGVNNAKSASYVRIGKLVIASFYFKGGTGANLGNGTIDVTLPFKVSNSLEKQYYGQAGIHSPGITGVIYPLTVVGTQDSSIATLFASNSANKNSLVNPGVMLYPFAADDVIRGSIAYTTDDA